VTVIGVRDPTVARKIDLHLSRFCQFIEDCYREARVSLILKRDVLGFRTYLDEEISFARSTTNNHLASVSGFCAWVHAQRPDLFALGNPCQGIGELPLPDLEPESLDKDQVKLLKSVCERLPGFYESHEKRYQKQRRTGKVTTTRLHTHARPYRDRAIISVFLSTGLRREELVLVNLDQIEPQQPAQLREARRAKMIRVHGKGKTIRTLWLSADARSALADYLEGERALDAATFAEVGKDTSALFLRASSVAQPKAPADSERGGRMAVRAVNYLVERIGERYNAELPEGDPLRIKDKLHPHTLRHTFAFLLADETDADAYELERRLGHRSERYIKLYTNPPSHIAASYIEKF